MGFFISSVIFFTLAIAALMFALGRALDWVSPRGTESGQGEGAGSDSTPPSINLR
jgi:hypothetical protein